MPALSAQKPASRSASKRQAKQKSASPANEIVRPSGLAAPSGTPAVVGASPRVVTSWMQAYGRLWQYVFEHGDSAVPQDFQDADGFRLGKWVHNQRTGFRALSQRRPPQGANRLSARSIELLEQVPGWRWHSRQRRRPVVQDWRELLSTGAPASKPVAEWVFRRR